MLDIYCTNYICTNYIYIYCTIHLHSCTSARLAGAGVKSVEYNLRVLLRIYVYRYRYTVGSIRIHHRKYTVHVYGTAILIDFDLI